MNRPEQCAPLHASLHALEAESRTIAPTPHPFWSGLSFLRQRWQQVSTRLAHAQELHAWQRTDRAGGLYWQAYDPVTGRSTTGSEADMRAWIEQLRYPKQ